MHEIDMESMEPQIIKTQDENGEIHNFELIDIVQIEGKEYGLLVYLDENQEASEDEEEEVIIMKLSKEDGAYSFETIEDEDEFNTVISYIESEGELEFDEEEEE